MKTPSELHLVHDKFIEIILGRIPTDLDAATKERLTISADVLCWALGHTHNSNFEALLQYIDAILESEGIEFKRIQ